jgi:hypothetical protein
MLAGMLLHDVPTTSKVYRLDDGCSWCERRGREVDALETVAFELADWYWFCSFGLGNRC